MPNLGRTVSQDSSSSSKSASHYLSSANPWSQRKGHSVAPDRTNVLVERGSVSAPPVHSSRTSLKEQQQQQQQGNASSHLLNDNQPRSQNINLADANDSHVGGVQDLSHLPRTITKQPRGSFQTTNSIPHQSYSSDTERTGIPGLSPLYSIGSVLMNHARSSYSSSINSKTDVDQSGSAKQEDDAITAITATTPISVTARGQSGVAGSSSSHTLSGLDNAQLLEQANQPTQVSFQSRLLGAFDSNDDQHRASRSNSASRTMYSRRASAVGLQGGSLSSDQTSQTGSDGRDGISKPFLVGMCCLDNKARSRPARNILNRITNNQDQYQDVKFEVIIFGDKVILDEEPENWPLCDYLISFFSEGFPLDKAIQYVRLRKPFCVNDLPMQMVLWDRRMCLRILDQHYIPTPERVVVTRDGGPRLMSSEIAQYVYEKSGVRFAGPSEDASEFGMHRTQEVKMLDEDTISVDGVQLRKPFVEKPVNGEDHNVYIYYAKEAGGGGRRLFRKINNKSSEADPSLSVPRSILDSNGSYIYEAFLDAENNEDVKAYAIGPNYCHAETRKSPVVDGIVKRNAHGKEVRYVTSLSAEEKLIASRVVDAFGQYICGFDILRVQNRSVTIDINGTSFVKNFPDYYDRCASILRELFINERRQREGISLSGLNSRRDSGGSIPQVKASMTPFQTIKSHIKSPSISMLSSPFLHYHHHTKKTEKDSSDTSLHSLPLTGNTSIERNLNELQESSQVELSSRPISSVLPPNSPPHQPVSSVAAPINVPPPATQAQWKLKGMVSVIRHADRTPKQKFKFTFHTKPFIDLLKGHREEVLLVGEAALNGVMAAVKVAMAEGVEDVEKLKLLRTTLMKRGAWTGTKVQIKPMFRTKEKKLSEEAGSSKPANLDDPIQQTATDSAESDKQEFNKSPRQNSLTGVTLSRAMAAEDNLQLEKLQLIVKWGGEPSHSARHQSSELGENMRNDLFLMNRRVLDDVRVFSSSERRVTTSAAIFAAAFLNEKELPPDFVEIRKDLLDDSNAAKDEMDKVKKKLKGLLREGNKAPPQFAWPADMPEPYIIARNVVDLLKFHRRVMRENYAKLYGTTAPSISAASSLAAVGKPKNVSASGSPVSNPSPSAVPNINSIQSRWCCGEDPELFRERWEKLFGDICDNDKIDPGKISELHDTIKFDSLHQRQFLEWIFMPSQSTLDEFYPADSGSKTPSIDNSESSKTAQRTDPPTSKTSSSSQKGKSERSNIAGRIGFRKRHDIDPATLTSSASDPATASYFSLFGSNARSRARTDKRLEKLRELFLYSKILFDFIGPQEYGITDSEKLEIGLLTSLPLLKAIVNDLEELQASPSSKSSFYFTKESHIYTLLNCIIEGGIKTKIQRNKIPELDYLSTICFELYESQNPTEDDEQDSFNYSIRITISPGCHTFEPLDLVLDSKHSIGFAQRRGLTAHNDWKEVIETLRAKFNTVKLPKSFIAINLAEKSPNEFGSTEKAEEKAEIQEFAEITKHDSLEEPVQREVTQSVST